MEYMIACAVWGAIAYFLTKEVKAHNKGLDVNPVYYGIGSFVFGILWCMLFLAYKVHKFKKSNQ